MSVKFHLNCNRLLQLYVQQDDSAMITNAENSRPNVASWLNG